MGDKPLPRSIRDRKMVFILGPSGVGKSSVADIWAGDRSTRLTDQDVLDAINHHARQREWPTHLLESSALVLECPCFLDRRPSALESLQLLLRLRAGRDRRTWVVEATNGTSMERVMSAVHPGYRATLVLRFPIGRGRLRFAKRICDELGLNKTLAPQTTHIEPWSYDAVRRSLEALMVAESSRS